MASEKISYCSALPSGWKRKEIIVPSGHNSAKVDVCYISPAGQVVNSKSQLDRCLDGKFDLRRFDFESGRMLGATGSHHVNAIGLRGAPPNAHVIPTSHHHAQLHHHQTPRRVGRPSSHQVVDAHRSSSGNRPYHQFSSHHGSSGHSASSPSSLYRQHHQQQQHGTHYASNRSSLGSHASRNGPHHHPQQQHRVSSATGAGLHSSSRGGSGSPIHHPSHHQHRSHPYNPTSSSTASNSPSVSMGALLMPGAASHLHRMRQHAGSTGQHAISAQRLANNASHHFGGTSGRMVTSGSMPTGIAGNSIAKAPHTSIAHGTQHSSQQQYRGSQQSQSQMTGSSGHQQSSAQSARSAAVAAAIRHDGSIVPPIRQTASIFKQPVTLVHTTSRESRPAPKNELKQLAGTKAHEPKQVFWAKRLENLLPFSPIDVEEAASEENVALPYRFFPIGPEVQGSVAIATLAKALQLPSPGHAVMGQTGPPKSLDSNPGVFVNPDQPLVQGVVITEQDIATQDRRVFDTRRRLEEALKHFG